MEHSIEKYINIHTEDFPQFHSLLSQLVPSMEKIKEVNEITLADLLGQKDYHLFVARDNEKKVAPIIGMASIIFYQIPTGYKAIIEDVIVDQNYRGKGIGKALTQELIKLAREKNVQYIDLTSSPSRVAANQLYQKLGFERRETNVYRLKIQK